MLRGHFRLQVRHLSPPTCGRKAGVPAGQQPRSEAAEFVRLYREMSEPRAVGGMCLPPTHTWICPVTGENAAIMKRAWGLPSTSRSNSAFLGGVTLDKSSDLCKPQVRPV